MADFEKVQPDEYKLLGKNFTAGRPWGITSVTLHHMAGDLDAGQCNNVWRKSGASAHYSIDRNGKIVQHVHDNDRAYACGDGVGVNSGGNDRSISIEHANNGSGPWTVHGAAIESGARLVAALCKYYKLGRPEWMKNVFPHSHWKATACPGELAGSQNAKYMRRAQEWYDAMMGGSVPAPAPQPAPKPQGLAVDGYWGEATTRRIQEVLGCPFKDGKISRQNPQHKHRLKACTGGWEFSAPWGEQPGSQTIGAIQRACGVPADGFIGPDTINAMIRHFKAESGAKVEDGKLDAGSLTVKAMQRALNEGRF